MAVALSDIQAMMSQQGQQPESQIPETEYRYTDAEIVALMDKTVRSSGTGDGSELDAARSMAYDYYNGQRPYAAGTNTSDYVAMEVFDSVESLKAKLIRTFASNRNVVRFRPTSERDVEQQEAKTKFVNKLIHGNDGQGYKMLHDVAHDGLVAKLATVKTAFRKRSVAVAKSFEQIPEQQLQSAADREDVQSIEIESESWVSRPVPTPMGLVNVREKVVSGTVTVLEDRSRIEIDVIPPECVHVPGWVTSLTDPDRIPAICIEYQSPRYELLQEGFDREVVAKLTAAKSPNSNRNAAARSSFTGGGTTGVTDNELCDVIEGWFWIDMRSPDAEDAGDASLWHFIKSGKEILLKEQVESTGLRFWTPYMIPHKAVGMSAADISMDIQAGATAATRGVIDNVHRVNAGVRIFNMSLIKNPADLIDNPIGGIIDSDRPDQAGTVAPQAQLSPATMGLMQIFSTDKEKRTGETNLGRGLSSQQVLSGNNAASMIDQLIEVGSDRPMMMARGFAELFWRPLMLDVWRIAVENDVTATIEVGGNLMPVKASQLPQSDELTVDIALTPDFGDQQARKILTVHQMLSQDQVLAPLYQMEERYAAISEALQLMGMANWLADPKDPKVQQRMAAAKQEGEKMKAMQLQLLGKREQREDMKVKATMMTNQSNTQTKKEALNLDAVSGAAGQNLKERQFAWEQQVDIAELNLEEKQKRPVKLGSGEI